MNGVWWPKTQLKPDRSPLPVLFVFNIFHRSVMLQLYCSENPSLHLFSLSVSASASACLCLSLSVCLPALVSLAASLLSTCLSVCLSVCFSLDLPQVDSLIFLVMTRYIGTIKKLKRAETPEIYRINRALELQRRERASKCRRQNRKSCEGLCKSLVSPVLLLFSDQIWRVCIT